MKMRRTVYEMIFSRLQQMGIINENGEMQADYMKFVSSGLMPLNVDKLTPDTIALAHNGKQNGDVMADPDIEVRIYPELKMAEALTFRNDYMGIYQEVYAEPGKYYPELKKELNDFLNNWLKTMIEVHEYQLTVKSDE